MDAIVRHDSFWEIWILGGESVFSAVEFDGQFDLLVDQFLQMGVFLFELIFSSLGLLFDFLWAEHMIKLFFDIGRKNCWFWGFAESIEFEWVKRFSEHLMNFLILAL